MSPSPTVVDNYINGSFHAPSTSEYLDVINPADDSVIGKVGVSNAADVAQAVDAASDAFQSWSKLTMKARATIMLKFHALIREHAQELATLIVAENGKNMTEALADVAKGNETVEYACSLPQLAQGRTLQVSGQVYCQDRRMPLGVVASIVPFNFPVCLSVCVCVCVCAVDYHAVDFRVTSHHHHAYLFDDDSSWYPCGPYRLPLSWGTQSLSNPVKRYLSPCTRWRV